MVRECNEQQVLFGQTAVLIARSTRTDDVIYFLPGTAHPFALVHLTYACREEYADFPWTLLVGSLDELMQKWLADSPADTTD